jgi:hypothetical protein
LSRSPSRLLRSPSWPDAARAGASWTGPARSEPTQAGLFRREPDRSSASRTSPGASRFVALSPSRSLRGPRPPDAARAGASWTGPTRPGPVRRKPDRSDATRTSAARAGLVLRPPKPILTQAEPTRPGNSDPPQADETQAGPTLLRPDQHISARFRESPSPPMPSRGRSAHHRAPVPRTTTPRPHRTLTPRTPALSPPGTPTPPFTTTPHGPPPFVLIPTPQKPPARPLWSTKRGATLRIRFTCTYQWLISDPPKHGGCIAPSARNG